jgi:hypothetical protein
LLQHSLANYQQSPFLGVQVSSGDVPSYNKSIQIFKQQLIQKKTKA